jgi:hypothetical protein
VGSRLVSEQPYLDSSRKDSRGDEVGGQRGAGENSETWRISRSPSDGWGWTVRGDGTKVLGGGALNGQEAGELPPARVDAAPALYPLVSDTATSKTDFATSTAIVVAMKFPP